jgi:hypothetical protein
MVGWLFGGTGRKYCSDRCVRDRFRVGSRCLAVCKAADHSPCGWQSNSVHQALSQCQPQGSHDILRDQTRSVYDSFAMLAWLLEKEGFFTLQSEYSISMTDSTFLSTRAIRSGKTYQVVEYAGGAPFELWAIDEAIQGLAFSTDWAKNTRTSTCPRWSDLKAPYH